MICIAIANQKGGVGKTTTAINIATAIAATGWRTLLVDLDPQGNASTGLGVHREDRDYSSYDLLLEEGTVAECTQKTRIPNLDIIPATQDLSGAEIELVSESDRVERLKKALAGTGAYDVCFIDCPPSLGLLTLNALSAADSLLVPLQCEFFALEGLSQLLQTVERVQQGAPLLFEEDVHGSGKKKKGEPNALLSKVGMTGLEPATTRPPDAYSTN